MMDVTEQLVKRLNELKRHTFFEILELAGRVFIVVDYSEDVIIGKRGFLPEEKERGLVLVFNSRMKFQWHEDALTATLVFGSTPERCYIPINAIAAVFSPDLRVQLTVPVFRLPQPEKTKTDKSSQEGSKVINISELRKKK